MHYVPTLVIIASAYCGAGDYDWEQYTEDLCAKLYGCSSVTFVNDGTVVRRRYSPAAAVESFGCDFASAWATGVHWNERILEPRKKKMSHKGPRCTGHTERGRVPTQAVSYFEDGRN